MLKIIKKFVDDVFYKVDPKWFRHEALHSTNLLCETLDTHLVNHHYYHSNINPKFNEEVDLAIEHLNKAYQACGNYEVNEVSKKIKRV